MTFEEFSEYQRKRNVSRLEMSDAKGRAYSGTKDRFDNFNRIAKRLRISREKVDLVYLLKHIDAIVSTIVDNEDGNEPISSRIDDAITYLELLDGMVYENLLPAPTQPIDPPAQTDETVSPPSQYVWRNPERKG